MKSFHETFKDKIDMTNGTVVLDQEGYNTIQKDALEYVLKLLEHNQTHGFSVKAIIMCLENEIEFL